MRWGASGLRALPEALARRNRPARALHGVFTAQEFKDVLYHTATSGGTDDDCQRLARGTVPGDDVPEPARQQFNGYGDVSALSLEAALPVFLGITSNPDRPDDDSWYERFHMLRTITDL